MRAILSDAQQTSVRLVMNPEKMVIKETRRTYTYLNLYGYFTDLVVANRILPDTVKDVYFQTWRASQQRNMQLMAESFGELPMLQAPLMEQEVVGLDMLDRFADRLFGDKDPVEFQRSGQVEQVREVAGGYEMLLSLPFVEKRDVNLSRYGDEVVIEIGQHRRNVILPNTLARCAITQAKMEEGILRLIFTRRAA
jgi:arsenite-transporting ATPase